MNFDLRCAFIMQRELAGIVSHVFYEFIRLYRFSGKSIYIFSTTAFLFSDFVLKDNIFVQLFRIIMAIGYKNHYADYEIAQKIARYGPHA